MTSTYLRPPSVLCKGQYDNTELLNANCADKQIKSKIDKNQVNSQ